MATLKLRHLVLFVITFGLFVASDLLGGAMLLLFAWMQLAILLWKKEFTLKNQIKFFVLFLFLLPTFFLWAQLILSFLFYAHESHLIFIAMYGLLSFIICFWVTLFSIFSYAYAKAEDPILSLFTQSIAKIKLHKLIIFYVSLIVYLTSIMPIPLSEDYRIVLGIVIAHCFLQFEAIKAIFIKT